MIFKLSFIIYIFHSTFVAPTTPIPLTNQKEEEQKNLAKRRSTETLLPVTKPTPVIDDKEEEQTTQLETTGATSKQSRSVIHHTGRTSNNKIKHAFFTKNKMTTEY